MGMAGCYVLDLYCDNDAPNIHTHSEFPHEYTHEFGSGARAKARKAGWTISNDGSKVICPKCNRATKGTKNER